MPGFNSDIASGAILQTAIPDAQRAAAARSLPRMQPVEGGWITVDEAYVAQIGEKQRLLAARPQDVLQLMPQAEAAAEELCSAVLEALDQRPDFEVSAASVRRPDGQHVTRDQAPLRMLSKLLQEDLCILQKIEEEHVLTGALLCFPASWTLTQKIGKPLTRIHTPVPSYGPVAARVQRLFDGVRPGRPMWRANLLRYEDPTLFQPRTEDNPRPVGSPRSPYERSERQTVLRLPKTDAVVFAIHTRIVRSDPQSPEK